MKTKLGRTLALALAAATMLGTAAQAHRQWLYPSSTILSGDDTWVTVDAAVSNDLFYFDHQPIRLDNVKVTGPDGAEVKIENGATGRYRSVFDVHLLAQGTYRIANASSNVMGSYTLNGEEKRLPRGTTTANLAAAIPAGATNVQTAEASNRVETYVTVGAPTETVFKTTGVGIELVPVTHPNDLVVGEKATFKFLLDGKPAANLNVAVVPGGKRYNDALTETTLKTDGEGKVEITWPTAGMYWLNVSMGGGREGGGMGGPGGPGGPGGGMGQGGPQGAGPAGGPRPPAGRPQRRAGYVVTLEVLAP